MKPWLFPRLSLALSPLLFLASPRAQAQAEVARIEGSGFMEPPPQQQQSFGYPVTGRMVCADTQKAARFAQVILIPVNQDGNYGRRLTARTDLDGNFLVLNVPAGDYYAAGSLAGYVNQSTLIQNALNAGTDPGSALAGVSLVHVGTGGGSAAISLQRGATLAGVVTWDDGTPAAGIGVSAQPVTSTTAGTANSASSFGRGSGGFGGFAGTQTDDRGRFRLSGLPPGSFVLRAGIQAPAPQRPDDRSFTRTLNLAIYAPDKLRRTDATVLTLVPGEERPDLTITLGLAGLHTVSGVVSASAAAVRSGSVNLTDQTDSSLTRNVNIAPDGSFTVPYVPPGTYTLRVSASAQVPSSGQDGGGNASSVRFQALQTSLTVTDGDLANLALTVTPLTGSAQ